jgi:hypothetical protein
MLTKPTIVLDNSALNRIAKEDDPKLVIAAMQSGYNVRVPEMAFGEAIGTDKPEVRLKLIEASRLLVANGSGITAAHWLIDRHVKRFHDYPHRYSWRNVQSRYFDLEEEMLSGRLYTDETLVSEQSAEMLRAQDEFEECFPKSDRTLDSFAEWLTECRVTDGSFWNTARLLYCAAFRHKNGIMIGRPLLSPPDDATLENFLDLCPPVRAIVYAFELTHFDRSLRKRQAGILSYKAGRNDQMMAVYLPYCDQFLTDDKPQHRCLTEVASAAVIPTRVRFYEEFRSTLPISDAASHT